VCTSGVPFGPQCSEAVRRLDLRRLVCVARDVEQRRVRRREAARVTVFLALHGVDLLEGRRDEAERLRGELDAVKRQAFDQTRAADEAAKTSRLELHQLRSQVASLEVERQQLASAKLDLVHQVNRQKKRAEERDEQVRRLTRLLETKDQTISEMGPRFKESRRATGQASTGLRESSARKGWKA